MHATRALDYLVLDASQRINYRVQRGISLQQWYESFKPTPIQGKDMNYREVCELLGIDYHKLNKLRGKGYFGEVRIQADEKRIKVSEINRILERESYLIPISVLYEIIKEQWHMGRQTFNKLFKKYYEHGLDLFAPYVSIGNAAKIIYELGQRKAIIENWPTLDDIIRDLGLIPNPRVRDYFQSRIRKLGISQYIIFWAYDPQGERKLVVKIPPRVYQEVLAIEREKIQNSEIGLTTYEIADAMGLSSHSVSNMISAGVGLGLLNPLNVTGRKHLLSPEEANLVINRQVPYLSTVVRREKRRQMMERIYTNLYDPIFQLPPTVRELWYGVKSRDNDAFSILLGLYEPIIGKVARNHSFNTYEEERRIFLTTALYEIIIESVGYLPEEKVIGALHKKLMQRRREDATTWISANARHDRFSRELSDLVDTEGRLWLN